MTTGTKTDITTNGAALAINNIAQGALGEIFQEEIGKVMENIADRDTDEKATRKIQITLAFKPASQRTWADCTVAVKSILAPTKPITVGFKIASMGGQVAAMEVATEQQTIPMPTHPEAV